MPVSLSAAAYPNVSFAVISDLHVYDRSLGVCGTAFEKALYSDRKYLLDNIELLDYAIGNIIASKAGFVLIPGDLTKDGELINHRVLAEKLGRFKDAGIAVYVVPGNHDINNPGAVSYNMENTAPVPSINAQEFSQIYGDFGFNGALERDDNSLSYVAEPVKGLWLLALDSCCYPKHRAGKKAIVSGKISKKTSRWIAKVLQTAAANKKAVIAILHHGVVEHWKGQAKLHPDFLVKNHAAFAEFLASHNVRLAFTGHYHAQDIAYARFGGKFIYDIETGSLSSASCPVRYLEIKDNVLQIRTDTILDKIRPDTDFAAKARAFTKKAFALAAAGTLSKIKVPAKDRDYIAGAAADAFVAHCEGDENPALRPAFDRSRLGLWGRFICWHQQYVLDGLWTNPPPDDNNASLEL